MRELMLLSSLGILGLFVYRFARRRPWLPLLVPIVLLASIYICLIPLRVPLLPWMDTLNARGAANGPSIATAYLAMLAGMLAHYLFSRLERPARARRRFDVGAFLAPVLVSPIVFLPLASLLESGAPGNPAQDAPRLMLLLVAFENGFFWREFFDNRLRSHQTEERS